MQKEQKLAKKASLIGLRRLGTALQDPDLGLAIRATCLAEPNQAKNEGRIRHPHGRGIYMWQARWPHEIRSNRELIRELRATLLSSAAISSNKDMEHWRDWKTLDYPAIMILKRRGLAYRGGYDRAQGSDYLRRGLKILYGFPKYVHDEIPKEDVAAVIRPTKKEMAEIERKLKNRNFFPLSMGLADELVRLMVNKAARAIAKVYAQELEGAKIKKE
ncbi:MAG: hypothetical protein NT157_03590 [Candidatus Micrarchaeota archaeon]|nr:hypothetical protein [Candidatus Micrarchaeota archaeon]